MPERRTFQVAEHRFIIESPNDFLSEKELQPYAPFWTDSCFEENRLFTLTLVEDEEVLTTKEPATADLEDENGKTTIFAHEDGSLTIYLTALSGRQCCRIRISKDYRSAKAWIGGTLGERCYALDTALMLLYTFASSKLDTLLVHASTVEYEGKGYLFLGKSGTGKSTHSSLWIENISGTKLLNDDNPIIRIVDGKVYVYGSPWSGKTGCYRNCRLPICGIVRLKQAPFNRIRPLTGIKAYATLLPSCSCMKWNHDMAEAIHSTISKVIERIHVYSLECFPNKEAALLCQQKLIADNVVGTHGPCVRKKQGNE